MITIATAILLALSIFISAFLGFGPQIHKLAENDLMRRAYNNSLLYGLQLGQIGVRAKTLNTSPTTSKNINLPFRTVSEGNAQSTMQDKFSGTVDLKEYTVGNYTIEVNVEHAH